jgi:pilus assembly protein CpaB
VVTAALETLLRDLRRAARWHRRLLAAGLAAAAVALSLSALSPAPPKLISVVVAARDLPGGTTLSGHDIGSRQLPRTAVPDQVLTTNSAAVGRVLVSAVRFGEPLTDLRLLGPSLLASLGTGRVAAPVRVADGSAVRLLRAGDTVDVVAAATASGVTGTDSNATAGATATVVAPAARVLLGVSPTEVESASEGALVVLAVDDRTALALARAAMYARLSIVLRPP